MNETLSFVEMGKNCRVAVEGDDIVIRINKTKRMGPSSTGKTIIVGSTEGAKNVEGIKLNISAYVK